MRRRQSGVAAITAILIVAVAASAATYMLAQQSATLNQAALVGSRAQADLFAQAGLDWARGILSQDARTSSIDSLDEGWAQPIAGLPVERALLSGAIDDAQSRFNLNNLVKDGKRSDNDVKILQRLLEALGLNPDLAWAVLDWIDLDGDLASPAGAEDAYYLGLPRPYRAANQPLAQVEELYRVRGFDAGTVDRLRPFVTALPVRTTVNANTAPAEVLAAIAGNLSVEEARSVVATRRAKPFRSASDIASRLPKAPPDALANDLGVSSLHFMVRILVAQDDVSVASEALVARGNNATTAIIWRRSLY